MQCHKICIDPPPPHGRWFEILWVRRVGESYGYFLEQQNTFFYSFLRHWIFWQAFSRFLLSLLSHGVHQSFRWLNVFLGPNASLFPFCNVVKQVAVSNTWNSDNHSPFTRAVLITSPSSTAVLPLCYQAAHVPYESSFHSTTDTFFLPSTDSIILCRLASFRVCSYYRTVTFQHLRYQSSTYSLRFSGVMLYTVRCACSRSAQGSLYCLGSL